MADNSVSAIKARAMRNYDVAKSNQLIRRSMYCLNLTEQRILACMISMLDSRTKEQGGSGDDSMICEISIDTFCELCNINRRASISYIKSTLLGLKNKSFWMDANDGIIKTFSWVDTAWIDTKKGTIIVKLHDDMKPYLLNLDSNFTHYKLPQILRFRSKHSNIIFDLIYSKYCECSYVYGAKRVYAAGNFQISLNDLISKVALKFDKNNKLVRKNLSFKDLRVDVIEPSISDINEFTDIQVDVEYIKKGRKIELIQFNYKPKKNNSFNDLLLSENTSTII